jgi:hypothetical protein
MEFSSVCLATRMCNSLYYLEYFQTAFGRLNASVIGSNHYGGMDVSATILCLCCPVY